jgi:hypothetical protein
MVDRGTNKFAGPVGVGQQWHANHRRRLQLGGDITRRCSTVAVQFSAGAAPQRNLRLGPGPDAARPAQRSGRSISRLDEPLPLPRGQWRDYLPKRSDD